MSAPINIPMATHLDYKVPNGKLIRLCAELDGNELRSVKITGDFFLHPEEKIADLERSLAGQKLDALTLQNTVDRELKTCQMAGISAQELVNALLKLL